MGGGGTNKGWGGELTSNLQSVGPYTGLSWSTQAGVCVGDQNHGLTNYKCMHRIMLEYTYYR